MTMVGKKVSLLLQQSRSGNGAYSVYAAANYKMKSRQESLLCQDPGVVVVQLEHSGTPCLVSFTLFVKPQNQKAIGFTVHFVDVLGLVLHGW